MSFEEYWGSFEYKGECVEGYWKNCCPGGVWTPCLDTSASFAGPGVIVTDPHRKPKDCGCGGRCGGHYTPPIAPRVVVEGFSADDLVRIVKALRSE